MGYTTEDLISIGERFHTESLLEWSVEVVTAARQDLPRLKSRGITEPTLKAIDQARDEVKKLNFQQEREKKDVSTLAVGRREAIEAALDWREEVRGLAEAVFDSETDVQARFRTGVKSSRSIPKLLTEVGILLGAVREHLHLLKGVGAGEALVARGEEIRRRLEELQVKQYEERQQTPTATADLYHAQGVLYTRARFVVRIAQVEFRGDEARADRYSYAPLRRQEAAAEGRRVRASRAAAAPSERT